MDRVEVASEEVLFARPGRARVERTAYTNGTVDYSVWVHEGTTIADAGEALRTANAQLDGIPVTLVELIHDDGLVGMIYRQAAN
ncbi:hypothetical protein [Nonomuraea sp. NPDC052265]|uniref:hypothetical protein n=1 Tax=Nonomuraea sp. NPDC052265 TaxID=3364374 RepID=UPI0037CC2587